MVKEENLEFWRSEGLDKYIPIPDKISNDYDPWFTISQHNTVPFPPELDDLVWLYKTVRSRKVLTILEFGTGYSTLVMALALRKNHLEYGEEFKNKNLRCSWPFRIYSVDGEANWIKTASERMPEELRAYVNISYSPVFAGLFNDRICSYYKAVPDIIPDFIYLDGPDTAQISGDINGSSWHNCPERTPNAADILLLEPVLVPGTMVAVDGRINNVRFLLNNLQRKWICNIDTEGDRAVLSLDEEPLGIHNERLMKFHGVL